MELRVLNYFLAIAREESFTRAAEQLHVTQPTLSRQIADLEIELGVKLFTRSNHNIRLTEDGMLLKRRAQELVSLADKTKRDFLYKAETLEGTIAIGSGEFLSTEILSNCIADFQKKYPLVRYEIFSGNADNIRDNIERGILDLGLMTEPVDVRKYACVSMPVKEQWCVLVRDDSPLAQKAAISPQDLIGFPIILPANILVENVIGKWMGQVQNELIVMARGNLLYNEAMLVRSRIGNVITMRMNCQYAGLRFIPLSPPLESTTALAWKKDQMFPAATATFIDFAMKYILDISEDNL